ncbi:hypothetical protein [Paenarthrobacter sp. AMU7]|uniref:Uncharacterized protein n=1 Tax=Paenarthrobacter sp. AMU7 TaxID=3162492 RepID=A0AB39YU79_9MICC
MGYTNPEEKVRIVVTLLEGATRWAPDEYDDAELESLADKAVVLSRTVLGLEL